MITVRKKLAVLIAVPLLFQIGMSIAFTAMLNRSEQLARYEYRSKEVIGGVNWLEYFSSTLALCWIGSVATGEQSFKESYQSMSGLLPREIGSVTSMYESSLAQKQRAAKLANILRQVSNAADKLDGSRADPLARIRAFYKTNCLQSLWSEGATLRAQLLEGERSRFKVNAEDITEVRDLEKSLFLIGLIAFVLVTFLVVLYYGKSISQRIAALTENALRLSREQPLNPVIEGNDEIALLDETFHKMAQALQEAAQKERAVVENAADLICALGADGCFLKVNPACEAVLGYTRESLAGSDIRRYVADGDDAVFQSNFEKVLASENAHTFELQFKKHDGSLVDLLLSMRWVEQDKSIFCVAHDLTERKKVERLRQDLMAMVSHDIRTPLTTIQGCLDFISIGYEDPDGAKRDKMLNVAQKCCRQVVALTSDLLDLDRIDSGMLQINKEKVLIQKVFDDAEALMREAANEKSVNLVVEPSESVIFADRNRIVQVVVNLLGNAIKFTPSGASVTLSASAVPAGVRVSVVDQGRGVPAEMRESIFERFRQVDAADSAMKRGTGLGLAICKALVDAHGGRIWCESEPGKGSAFHFELSPD